MLVNKAEWKSLFKVFDKCQMVVQCYCILKTQFFVDGKL